MLYYSFEHDSDYLQCGMNLSPKTIRGSTNHSGYGQILQQVAVAKMTTIRQSRKWK
jgi:hypothetical protein